MNWNGRQLFTWPVILGALGLALVLMLISLAGAGLFHAAQPAAPDLALAALTVIPAPTATPMIQLAPPEALLGGPAAAASETIAVGVYVQITGTDGDGLRIRAAASLTAEPLFLGYDEEVFLVSDGPQEADGYTWWYLTAPYDQSRAGWAAANFLAYIPAPTGE
jgi:hypothetical protein